MEKGLSGFLITEPLNFYMVHSLNLLFKMKPWFKKIFKIVLQVTRCSLKPYLVLHFKHVILCGVLSICDVDALWLICLTFDL